MLLSVSLLSVQTVRLLGCARLVHAGSGNRLQAVIQMNMLESSVIALWCFVLLSFLRLVTVVHASTELSLSNGGVCCVLQGA